MRLALLVAQGGDLAGLVATLHVTATRWREAPGPAAKAGFYAAHLFAAAAAGAPATRQLIAARDWAPILAQAAEILAGPIDSLPSCATRVESE